MLERVGNLLGHFANRNAAAAADIYRQAIELVGFRREQIGARDVFDEGQVARLFAIFEKNRRQIVEQARAENRDHSGVRIEDRLARAVGAGITQRHRRNADLFSPEQHQLFLVDFR